MSDEFRLSHVRDVIDEVTELSLAAENAETLHIRRVYLKAARTALESIFAKAKAADELLRMQEGVGP